jgi:FRG domain
MSGRVRVISYGSWAEFRRDLFVELYEGGPFDAGRYLFRGVADANWTLRPAFDRRFEAVPAGARVELWERVLADWREGCEELRVPPSVLADERELAALGQHHGLPTRLLDWTTKPYVAAYFAFRDHLVNRGGRYEHVAVWALHARDPVWRRTHGVELVTAPVVDNLRLRNQGGRFTLSRAPFDTLEEYVERFATEVALTKCVLPAAEAEPALSDLDSMGITSFELFPDLTGLATRTAMRAALRASG